MSACGKCNRCLRMAPGMPPAAAAKLCAHYHNDPKYRALWDQPPRQRPRSVPRLPPAPAVRQERPPVPKAERPRPAPQPHPAPAPKDGPGTELKALLASLGVTPTAGCGCGGYQEAMNRWGVEGCRARIDEIAATMSRNAASMKVTWWDKVQAAARAVVSGLAFRIDPADPFRSLAEEAIRRAEAKVGQDGPGISRD